MPCAAIYWWWAEWVPGPSPLSESIVDLLIRSGFGAAISSVARIVSALAGTEPGGILLAFPAILPATLTLVEKEESERQAEGLDVGSILGATALAAFAVVVWRCMGSGSAPLVCWPRPPPGWRSRSCSTSGSASSSSGMVHSPRASPSSAPAPQKVRLRDHKNGLYARHTGREAGRAASGKRNADFSWFRLSCCLGVNSKGSLRC